MKIETPIAPPPLLTIKVDPPLVFVDIETTGGSAQTSRILEVAAIKFADGQIVDTFSTLLNPDEAIPPFITQLTGISEPDVVDAPFFNQIAWQLHDFLSGALFVAHNVSFDLGFIQAEFRRLGADFAPPRLCTVQLSRHFYAAYRSHKLGSLIERHNLAVDDRHRAYADAKAILDFYQLIKAEFGVEALATAQAKLTRRPRRSSLEPVLRVGSSVQN